MSHSILHSNPSLFLGALLGLGLACGGGSKGTPSSGPAQVTSPIALAPREAPQPNPTTGHWVRRDPDLAQHGTTWTVLGSGRVLMVGAILQPFPAWPATAAIHDPVTGAWTLANPLGKDSPTAFNTATRLQDGHRVLVTFERGDPATRVQIFNEATGLWAATNPPALARQQHTATLLRDGRVLVTGGRSATLLSACELYDPALGTWTATGHLHRPRARHTATLLADGKVLVVGGARGAQDAAELYDPITGLWEVTADSNSQRTGHTATLLPDGKVLLVGAKETRTVACFDPVSRTWAATAPLHCDRYEHTATLLKHGQVLVVGGKSVLDHAPLKSAELFDPATGTWTVTDPMGLARDRNQAVLLPDGTVLVGVGARMEAQAPGQKLMERYLPRVSPAAP